MTSSSVGRWASQGCRPLGLRDRSPTREVRTANPGRSTIGPPPARVVVGHEPIVEGPAHPSAPGRARCGAGLPRGADDATRAAAPEARAAVARHASRHRRRPRRRPHARWAQQGAFLTTSHRRAAARHRPLAARRAARADPPAGPPPAREDHPLRPRAHPRAGRPRPRRRSTRHLRRLRQLPRTSRSAAFLEKDVETPVFVRFSTVAGLTRLGRHGPRHPRLRDEVLHRAGQLRPRRKQHPGLLHPGRHQVPRHHPRREAAPRPRDPPGPVGARHLLGLRLAAHRGAAPRDLGDVRPRHPPLVPAHGGLRGPHLPTRRTPRATPPWSSSTGSRGWACTR